MKQSNLSADILNPNSQLELYGYKEKFNFFVSLFKKNKLPNSILLSGSKGIGKSTFAYHFINYLFSVNEENPYSVDKNTINKNNLSYRHLLNNTHTNFFLIEKEKDEKEIKIENIRNLLKFLSKTTDSRNLKIVLIDNVEDLNINSSNTLLKALEEPNENTFFFLIYNNANRLINTIKSRCINFNFFLSYEQKKTILQKILYQYDIKFDLKKINNSFVQDSPRNFIKFLSLNSDNLLDIIFEYLNNFKLDKNLNNLNFLSLLIEKYYNELLLNNNYNIMLHLHNYSKVILYINNLRKFNLNDKNTLILIEDILLNEKK